MTWSPHTTRKVTHAEAHDAADRLIAGSFRRDGERLPYDSSPQFSVPADKERDSDLLLTAYIKQQEAADLVAAHTDEEARLAALRDALRTLCIQREGHFHTEAAWATARELVGLEAKERSW